MDQRNKVIIGRRPMHEYIPSILIMFEEFDTVMISAIQGNICKQDRIVSLFRNIGITAELKKEKFKDDIFANVYTLRNVHGKESS
jgi:DNA-binding protein